MLWKCILQAEDGTGLPEEILDQSNFQNAAKLYFIFIRFDFVWSLTYFALIVLNFLEVCTFFFPFNFCCYYFHFHSVHWYKAFRQKEKEYCVVLSRYLFIVYCLFIFFLGGYVFILNLLNFVQKPLWCTNYSTYSCDDREYFFLGELPYLTGLESLIYEVRVVCQKNYIWLVEYLWHLLLLYQ
jgi:hypothetical protein